MNEHMEQYSVIKFLVRKNKTNAEIDEKNWDRWKNWNQEISAERKLVRNSWKN